MTDEIKDLLSQVYAERLEQLAQWGVQEHRSLYSEQALKEFQRKADSYKQVNDARVSTDDLSWDGILLEEVYEALSETEPTLRIVELIQVAAVAIAEAEALQRLLDDLDEAYDLPQGEDEEEVA